MTSSPQTGQPADPAQLAQLYAEIAQKSGQLLSRFIERGPNGAKLGFSDELGIAQAFKDSKQNTLTSSSTIDVNTINLSNNIACTATTPSFTTTGTHLTIGQSGNISGQTFITCQDAIVLERVDPNAPLIDVRFQNSSGNRSIRLEGRTNIAPHPPQCFQIGGNFAAGQGSLNIGDSACSFTTGVSAVSFTSTSDESIKTNVSKD